MSADQHPRRRTGVIHGFGPGLLLEAARILLTARPRSLADDAALVVPLIGPAPRVEGLNFIPPRGPFLLVANHLQQDRWWVGWVGAAISHIQASVRVPEARELHWVVLSEWPWLQLAGCRIANPVSTLLFPRAARAWGLVMMPAHPADTAGRANALRQIFSYLDPRDRRSQAESVGFFPEGRASVELLEAMPGTGVLLHRVSQRSIPLLPVGVYQEHGGLVIRFGPPFLLEGAPAATREETDAWARERVMVGIGRLLPQPMWGAYAGAIGRAETPPAN